MKNRETEAFFSEARKFGSMKRAYLAHEDEVVEETRPTYGIENVDYLFPDYRALENVPQFIKRDDNWVSAIINSTHHTPFSRVKSLLADITEDTARAKGYLKGNEKKTEFFTALKRTTEPQTIYKKQKMDRDDILDITDFDVVSWIRSEMRMMLEEEIARAILIGDGRLDDDDDHIKTDRVRPIAYDNSTYAITVTVDDSITFEKDLIKSIIRARKDYRGSGAPVMFVGEDLLTEMMLLEDGFGYPLYDSEATLAKHLRVSKIVTCPLLEASENSDLPLAVIVNLFDYNVGSDKGGVISSFDDFDIDYNQQKYLIETRISGALIRPKSAIVIFRGEESDGYGEDDSSNEIEPGNDNVPDPLDVETT